MLSNLEQAIANVLKSDQTPDYHNVMSAYLRLYQGTVPDSVSMMRAPLLFERAMDKYPDVGEKVGLQAPFAKLIASFRKTQWQYTLDVATTFLPGDRFPCPCCGIPSTVDDIRRKLGLSDNIKIEEPPAKPKKVKLRRRVSNKTKSKKSNGRTLAFDPYGPSTSASSM